MRRERHNTRVRNVYVYNSFNVYCSRRFSSYTSILLFPITRVQRVKQIIDTDLFYVRIGDFFDESGRGRIKLFRKFPNYCKGSTINKIMEGGREEEGEGRGAEGEEAGEELCKTENMIK